jgi:hypothetical protein
MRIKGAERMMEELPFVDFTRLDYIITGYRSIKRRNIL